MLVNHFFGSKMRTVSTPKPQHGEFMSKGKNLAAAISHTPWKLPKIPSERNLKMDPWKKETIFENI